MPGIDGGTLRAWRRSRSLDVPALARLLRQAAGDDPVPVHKDSHGHAMTTHGARNEETSRPPVSNPGRTCYSESGGSGI
jgi:hypothetical protein